jgi:hypothetical protein
MKNPYLFEGNQPRTLGAAGRVGSASVVAPVAMGRCRC